MPGHPSPSASRDLCSQRIGGVQSPESSEIVISNPSTRQDIPDIRVLRRRSRGRHTSVEAVGLSGESRMDGYQGNKALPQADSVGNTRLPLQSDNAQRYETAEYTHRTGWRA